MGKIKRGGQAKGRDSKPRDVSDTEEYADTVDPNATDFIYDNVDEHFLEQEREGAQKLAKLMKKPRRVDQVREEFVFYLNHTNFYKYVNLGRSFGSGIII